MYEGFQTRHTDSNAPSIHMVSVVGSLLYLSGQPYACYTMIQKKPCSPLIIYLRGPVGLNGVKYKFLYYSNYCKKYLKID